MIDPEDAVMLMIDHQSGLSRLVKDIEPTALPCQRRGAAHGGAALPTASKLAQIPMFTTASVPDGEALVTVNSTT